MYNVHCRKGTALPREEWGDRRLAAVDLPPPDGKYPPECGLYDYYPEGKDSYWQGTMPKGSKQFENRKSKRIPFGGGTGMTSDRAMWLVCDYLNRAKAAGCWGEEHMPKRLRVT